MEEDKLIEFIQKTKDQIKEVKVKRNFVQQERDMITEFYEISKQEEKKLRDACEKEEIVMDHLQQEHQNEINAFINKYRHLEYDHDIFINENLFQALYDYNLNYNLDITEFSVVHQKDGRRNFFLSKSHHKNQKISIG